MWFTKLIKTIQGNWENDVENVKYDSLIMYASLGIIVDEHYKEVENLGIPKKLVKNITGKIIKLMNKDAKIRWNERCKETKEIQKILGIDEILKKMIKKAKDRDEIT